MHSNGARSIFFAALAMLSPQLSASSSKVSPGFLLPIPYSGMSLEVFSKNLCFHQCKMALKHKNVRWLSSTKIRNARNLRHRVCSISNTIKFEMSDKVKQQDEVQLNFLDWAKKNGIQCDLLKISYFDGLRGLAATQELSPGQVAGSQYFICGLSICSLRASLLCEPVSYEQ